MTDHFSVIGFNAGSAEELADLVTKLPEHGGQSQPCAPGYYYRWRSDVGSELWIHMAKEKGESGSGDRLSIVGVTPFFVGEGRLPVRVMRIRQRPFDNAFEGAVFVEVAPGKRPHECATVALFDVVDFACWTNRVTPFLAQAQIAAFPHDLAIFIDDETFALAQENYTVRFASESFFASGLFAPTGEHSDQPVFHDPDGEQFNAPSHAFFTGRVLKADKRCNPVTNQDFYWALVRTLGGTMDVVADASLIQEPLRPGMVIQGEFWLCGRLINANGHDA